MGSEVKDPFESQVSASSPLIEGKWTVQIFFPRVISAMLLLPKSPTPYLTLKAQCS